MQVTTGQVTQADAARKWGVDIGTVINIGRTVKGAALAAPAAKPGRQAKEHDCELEPAKVDIAQLTETLQAQAGELAVARGKTGWAL